MDLNYKCNHSPDTDALIVRDAPDDTEDDRLSFAARVGGQGDDHEVLLTQEDAVDLAWSILEHYNHSKRPQPRWEPGDYLVMRRANRLYTGFLGRVTAVHDTYGHVSLSVVGLAGERHCFAADDCNLISSAQFRARANTRIDEIMK